MPTLILTPHHTEDSRRLWRAAMHLGWGVERLPSWRVPEHLRSLPEPVLYVEALLGPAIAEQFGLQLAEPPDDWLPRLPEEHRKRRIELTTLRAARLGSAPAFVKPPNDKSFPAGVYTGPDLPPDFDPDMPVLTAEVVAWEKEFRCFVLDRQIRTLSVYLRRGELQAPHGFPHTPEEEAELRAFLEGVLADPRVPLPQGTVLDVGLIEGRGWAVVEQNGAWAAGLYGCDPAAVLDVLQAASAPPLR